MLIIAPIFLLILAALIIVIVNRTKENYPISFMLAAISTFAAWLITLILRLYLPSTFPLVDWKPQSLFLASPFLSLDYQSWSFALSLITICMAAIFTDSARSSSGLSPVTWAGSLSITAFGMIALLAGNPLTMILAWAFMDIIEFFYLLFTQRDVSQNQRILLSFALHLLSILMFFWATMVGWHEVGGAFDFTNMPASASIYFLLAAGLRLGILPLNLPFFNEPVLNRGLSTLIRLAPVASSLCLIGRLPSDAFVMQPQWKLLLQAMTTLAAIYTAIRWTIHQDKAEAKPYWIISLSAISLYSAINGYPEASRAWGIALLLSGSMLFLYHPHLKRLRYLLFFGLAGLVALPFTPAVTGWDGLIGGHFTIWTLVMILAHAILVFGYVRFIFNAKASAAGLETWAKIIFPLGLIIIIQSDLITGLVGWPGSFTLGKWWAGLVSALIAVSLLFLVKRFKLDTITLKLADKGNWISTLQTPIKVVDKIFRLEWLYQLLLGISKLLSKLTFGITAVLEGEGGILWALLILLLLITVIMAGDGV
jgi:hypothetical protein